MSKQITRRQHYVPQFYLNKWVNQEGGFYPIKIVSKDPPVLEVFDNQSNVSSFCNENFFYAQHTGKADKISQDIEDMFTSMEGDFSSVLPAIEEKILTNQQITPCDKYLLSEFMIFIWLRGKHYRQQSVKMTEDVVKKINKFLVYDIDKDKKIKKKMDELGLTKEDMIKFVEKGDYSVDFGNMHHLEIMLDMKGFCNILSAKYWKILISRDGKFITTDTPYLDMPVSKTFWGNNFLSRKQSFILSPNIFIIALNPNNDYCKKIKRKDISLNLPYIQQINLHNLMNSIKFGFHQDRELLEGLKENIVSVYNNHKR